MNSTCTIIIVGNENEVYKLIFKIKNIYLCGLDVTAQSVWSLTP